MPGPEKRLNLAVPWSLYERIAARAGPQGLTKWLINAAQRELARLEKEKSE